MAKGKGKKGKKPQEEVKADPNAVSEVDKTFYELQITDLNRKLARLRELTANLEEKNTELEQKYVQLDEDRADVIAYLKKQLTEKQNEASELQERLLALQEAKENEKLKFDEKVKDMDEEYRIMKEQLTSEIKLITGKLNALEEFRIHRDELMKKFVDQEKAIEEQEIRHKRTLYEAEKMYIMSKDTIKKDMEKRIIELAKDFQKANEIRIAATTHRIIRENIAINNEMHKLQEIIERLTHENEDFKLKNRSLKQNCDLYTTERNMALGKSKIHRGVIDQLKTKYTKLYTDVQDFKSEVDGARQKEKELYASKKEIENLSYKIRVLEQNLHATQCETFAAKKMLNDADNKAKQLRSILFESVEAIEQSLKVSLTEADESEKYSKRESLLYYLLRLINEGHKEIIRCESTDTIESVKAAYIRGDLGFVPKLTPSGKRVALKLNTDTQIGKSLEDMQKFATEDFESTVSQITILGRYASEPILDELEGLSEEELGQSEVFSAVSSVVLPTVSRKSHVMFSEIMQRSQYDVTLSKLELLEADLDEEQLEESESLQEEEHKSSQQKDVKFEEEDSTQ